MEKATNSVPIKTCPNCEQPTLVFEESSNQYECLICGNILPGNKIDKNSQEETLNDKTPSYNTKRQTIVCSGSEYYDTAKKVWRYSNYFKYTSRLFWYIVLIGIGIIIILTLNYFYLWF